MIIADSSPLIALTRINQLEILQDLYAEVLVPPAVWEEITLRGIDRPGAYEISKTSWIKQKIPDIKIVESLSILTDRGEAEVIALARVLPDSIVLLDDSQARRVAERFAIPRIGTLGILRRAKKAGLIDKLRPHTNALRENNIYIRQDLIDAVLKDVGE